MRWRLALVVLALSAPWATADPFLQPGGDAAHSGLVSDAGPANDDLAFQLHLDAALAVPGYDASPVVLGGHAFFLASTSAGGEVLDLDLARATIATRGAVAGSPLAIGSDGRMLVVATTTEVDALSPDGSALWRAPHASPITGPVVTCALALAPPAAFVACGRDRSSQWIVERLALATGKPDWVLSSTSVVTAGAAPPEVTAPNPFLGYSSASVLGEHVIVHALNENGGYVISVAAGSGQLEWVVAPRDAASAEVGGSAFVPSPDWSLLQEVVHVTGSADHAFTTFGSHVLSIETTTGKVEWSRPLISFPSTDPPPDLTGLAFDGQQLVVFANAPNQPAFLVDVAARKVTRVSENSEGQYVGAPVLASGRIFGATDRIATSGAGAASTVEPSFFAIDRQGRQVLRVFFPTESSGVGTPPHYAIGEGVAVVVTAGGTVAVVGRTAASLTLAATSTTLYPAVNASVQVDLANSTAGVFGPPTEYRADWGDGNVTPWQPVAVLSHAYRAPGEAVARFTARNAANQTSSGTIVFHVGGSPPPAALAQAQAAASPLVVAAGALSALGLVLLAALVVVPRARRRTLVARELRALERAHRDAARDEAVWALALASRRARWAEAARARKLSASDIMLLEAKAAALFPSAGGADALPAGRVEVGALVGGRYRVTRLLGEGGQGRAFLARDERIERDVVLKTVSTVGRGARATRALVAEARAAGGIDHANIVRVHDVMEGPSEAVLVLEYAPGGTLRDLLARQRLGVGQALALADGVLAGLEAAHARGIVHRDIKPENVLLDANGTPKLSDFGAAARESTDGSETARTTAGVGTLAYMAPEQVRGEAATRRTDVYAVGALLYEMLAGERHIPMAGRDDYAFRSDILTRAPDLAPIPERLRAVLARALAKDPAARYADAREMRDALRG